MKDSIHHVTRSMNLTREESEQLAKATLDFFPLTKRNKRKMVSMSKEDIHGLANDFLKNQGTLFFSQNTSSRPRWGSNDQEDRMLTENVARIIGMQMKGRRKRLKRLKDDVLRRNDGSMSASGLIRSTHFSRPGLPFEDQDYEPSIIAVQSRAGSLPETRTNSRPGMPMIRSVEESSISSRSRTSSVDSSQRSITLDPSELSTDSERQRIRRLRAGRLRRKAVLDDLARSQQINPTYRDEVSHLSNQASGSVMSNLRVSDICSISQPMITLPERNPTRQSTSPSWFSNIDFDNFPRSANGGTEQDGREHTTTARKSTPRRAGLPILESRVDRCEQTPPGSARSISTFARHDSRFEEETKPAPSSIDTNVIDLTKDEEGLLYLGFGISRAVPKDQAVEKMQFIFEDIENKFKQYMKIAKDDSLTLAERKAAEQAAVALWKLSQELRASKRLWNGTRRVDSDMLAKFV